MVSLTWEAVAPKHKGGAKKHDARDARRDSHTVEFIGVDGEGITLGNTHHYVLLSVGDQSIYYPDSSPLKTADIFDFLWDQYLEHPKAVFVGYFLEYDFTHWLKGLPESRAWKLLSNQGIASRQRKTGPNPVPFPVNVGEYELDMLGNLKRFKLRKQGSPSWLTVCDVGPFFQVSFLKAVDPAGWPHPLVSQEEYATLQVGKARRASACLDAEMIAYNVMENEILSRLMERYNEGLSAIDIKLNKNQWFGPGQATAEWLKLYAPPREAVTELPQDLLKAAIASYYGGWFEIFAHGTIPGPTYEYDINSAYPHAIAQMPCLLHGKWSHQAKPIIGSGFTLVHATCKGTNKIIGAMPHRDTHGVILHPYTTSGWYWLTELMQAQLAGLVSSYAIDDSWTYTPCECPPPFASIADLYELRLEVGKNGPQGRALRLVYNSAYGKMAQSVGQAKFANPIYASWITSYCRTMILEAIATHPSGTDSLLMIATDGIYFREPHPYLPISPSELGAWDAAEKHNLSLFMPGVYWDDHTRENLKALALKSRGIPAADLAAQIQRIDDEWAGFNGRNWPGAEITIPFSYVSLKQALQWGKWRLAGQILLDKKREIYSRPVGKRTIVGALDNDVWRTRPRKTSGKLESTPYAKGFGLDLIWDDFNHDGPIDLQVMEEMK